VAKIIGEPCFQPTRSCAIEMRAQIRDALDRAESILHRDV
jgi:hypothetical protein